jgi:hypothetical protein
VTLEFEKCYIVGTYVVNAGEKLKVMHIRPDFQTPLTDIIINRQWMAKRTGMLHSKPTCETWIPRSQSFGPVT